MRTISLAAAFSAILSTFAAPTVNIPIAKHAGPVKANSYIIKLKDDVSKGSHLIGLLSSTTSSRVEYKYEQIFHGYAAELKGKDLDYVRQSSDVEYILEDGVFTIQNDQSGQETTRGGIYTAHNAFWGRARWGATFGGHADADGNGHGTHTATTAVGSTYGVATSANVIAVKGSGSYSDVIAGINYVVSSAASSGRPSIATLSIGGSANSALDAAIITAIGKGIHFTVAAGGSNTDVSNTSPARVAVANTVGAVDSSNRRASFSNYGPLLDVWAPGCDEHPQWDLNVYAFVAGVLAAAIGDRGNKSPADLSADLKTNARALVEGAPSGTTNLLATRW